MRNPNIDPADIYCQEPERTHALRLAQAVLDAYAVTEVAPIAGVWDILAWGGSDQRHIVPCGCPLNVLAEQRGLVQRRDGDYLVWTFHPPLNTLAAILSDEHGARYTHKELDDVMSGWDDGDCGRYVIVSRLPWSYQAGRAVRLAFERAGHTVMRAER